MKRVKKKVLSIKTSRDKTIQGNPRAYWYLLECGHILHEFHKAVRVIDMFMLAKDILVNKVCRGCSRESKEPLNFDMMRNIFGLEFVRLFKKDEILG